MGGRKPWLLSPQEFGSGGIIKVYFLHLAREERGKYSFQGPRFAKDVHDQHTQGPSFELAKLGISSFFADGNLESLRHFCQPR